METLTVKSFFWNITLLKSYDIGKHEAVCKIDYVSP